MKITEIVQPADVHLDLEGREIMEALDAVAKRVAAGIGLEPGTVVESLLERERLGSTTVGDGFAIPHSKISELSEIAVFLARFSTPVDFGATDELPVQFFFVVLSPPDQPAAHLQVLSQIARVLKRSELKAALMSADDAEAVVQALRDAARAEGL
jgi:mannitol/fructose-specific phosphotransferase system IIA component (Ntr-type)